MKLNILTDYWHDSLTFYEEEKAKRDELMGWLPNNIFDCHAHCCLPGHIQNQSKMFFSYPASTFPYFSLDQSHSCHDLFYPGKKVVAMRFGLPVDGYDLYAQNEYLLSNSGEKDRAAAIGIPADLKYTRKMINDTRVRAIKIYPLQNLPPAIVIIDYFTPEILAEVQSANKTIVLHLPKPVWFCIEELIAICQSFPKLKIVLAHAGLCYLPDNRLEDALRSLAPFGNLYIDTAMVPSSEPISQAINILGAGRVLYGSDEPMSYARWVEFSHPTLGTRSMPRFRYHWVNDQTWSKYRHLAKNAIHNHWNTLSAIQKAVMSLPKGIRKETKRNIFFDNASNLFG
jgi:hypothetical protein